MPHRPILLPSKTLSSFCFLLYSSSSTIATYFILGSSQQTSASFERLGFSACISGAEKGKVTSARDKRQVSNNPAFLSPIETYQISLVEIRSQPSAHLDVRFIPYPGTLARASTLSRHRFVSCAKPVESQSCCIAQHKQPPGSQSTSTTSLQPSTSLSRYAARSRPWPILVSPCSAQTCRKSDPEWCRCRIAVLDCPFLKPPARHTKPIFLAALGPFHSGKHTKQTRGFFIAEPLSPDFRLGQP